MTDPRDDDLVGLYRQLPRPEPPAALDAAVLAAARAAVRPRRPAWLAPVAAAAAMVLAVGVGWQLRHEPLRETSPAVAPATAPAPEPAAAADTLAVPAAEAVHEEAKAESAPADQAAAAPVPQAVAPAPSTADAAANATAGAARARSEARPAAPAADRRASDLDGEQERLEEITVTGSRVATPRQRTIATPPPPESQAAPAPPVAEPAAVPPPPPAPPAPPVPAEPPVAADAALAKSLSSERVAGAAARTEPDAIAAAFDDIRALRAAGRRDEAVAALARLLDEHPALEVPEDLRDLRR